MRWRRGGAWLFGLWLAATFALPAFFARAEGGDAVSQPFAEAMLAEDPRNERALLIGMDAFVSKPNIYPSSTNNVYAMQEVFQAASRPLEALIIPSEPITSARELTELIQETFLGAEAEDISYLYISTHGEYDPASGEEPALLLSDGEAEGRVTAAELEAAFDGIEGQKVLILDACNSGAFIGKGEPGLEKPVHFIGGDFKVLTSSGALEESWYWSAADAELEEEAPLPEAEGAVFEGLPVPGDGPGRPQGAFYFTQMLLQGLSPRYGYPADGNRDGLVTLRELYGYLLENHAASTPQVYPQQDEFVFFRYDTEMGLSQDARPSPILDVTFSGTSLDQENQSVTLEYTATRPVRVGYQIVYQQDGKWSFDRAKLLFDDVERFMAFGDQEGVVSAGRKVRTLTLNLNEQEAYGYMLVQLVSIDQGRITVHAGRVLCVPPRTGELGLAVEVRAEYDREARRELEVFVRHDYPCELSVAVVNERDEVVARLCHRRSTRPSQTVPSGSLLYWDGTDKNGNPVPKGTYRIRASAVMGELGFGVMSNQVEIR